MDDTYIYSLREHLAGLKNELQGLTEISEERVLSRYEYRASERTLQVLIEACIGIAKHWCYSLTKTAPADAYSAFEKLSQQGIESVNEVPWRKIIGMRNALVHACFENEKFNLEPEIIRAVIKRATYSALFDFSESGLNELEKIFNKE